MHFSKRFYLSVICLFVAGQTLAQSGASFKVVPLGVKGGIDESNLSAYMVAPVGSNNYVCMDAGTLHAGIEKAIEKKTFSIPAEAVLRRYIKGYFISHSHLDHLSGLLINAPDDTTKTIYAFADCIETFKTHYFTWKSWANFADQGETPALKKFHYEILEPGAEIHVANTELEVTAYPLSHSNLTSTAFLINHKGDYLLYLGDVGPDAIEKSQKLSVLWQTIAPLIKSHQLKAIMIEVSFPDDQPDKTLFGHLTPHWLMTEMNNLASEAGPLKGLNVVITHVKPPESKIALIKKQVIEENKLGLHIIFPEQGKKLEF